MFIFKLIIMEGEIDYRKIYMTKIDHKHTRVGKDYQAVIPEFKTKDKKALHTVQSFFCLWMASGARFSSVGIRLLSFGEGGGEVVHL